MDTYAESVRRFTAFLTQQRGQAFDQRRDMAIIGILPDTGLRRAEMACITIEDVDLDQQTLRVVGKAAGFGWCHIAGKLPETWTGT